MEATNLILMVSSKKQKIFKSSFTVTTNCFYYKRNIYTVQKCEKSKLLSSSRPLVFPTSETETSTSTSFSHPGSHKREYTHKYFGGNPV